MAGGPSTPALVAAAAEAGALGFLASGYKSAEAVAGGDAAVRAAASRAFGVNVFVPGTPAAEPARDGQVPRIPQPGRRDHRGRARRARMGRRRLAREGGSAARRPSAHRQLHVRLPITRDRPEVFQRDGSAVAVTVTHPDEARLAAGTGADCLCVQGTEAGAHRARSATTIVVRKE